MSIGMISTTSKTPMEHIDGTEHGSKMAMASLASSGAFLMLLRHMSNTYPIFFGSGAGLGLGKIGVIGSAMAFSTPFVPIATGAALLGYAWYNLKAPRKVKAPLSLSALRETQLYIGETARKGTVWWHFRKIPHCKIAGATGSGKSVMMESMLFQIARNVPGAEIHVIDMKGSTYAHYDGLPMFKPIATTTAASVKVCEDVEGLMWERLRTIQAERAALRPCPQFPPVFLFVDEGGELAPSEAATPEEKKLRSRCMQAFSTLARIGREPNVHLVYGTQRPDVDTIPMAVRGQCEFTICFRCENELDSQIVLRHKGAEKLPLRPGRCIVKTPSGEVETQAGYYPEDVVWGWVREQKFGDTPPVDESNTLPKSAFPLSTPDIEPIWGA